MLTVWRTALRECCQIYTNLPIAAMCTISGSGARRFRRSGAANVITICPRLHDGALAVYIYPDDVRLVASDGTTHKPLRVQVQLSIGKDGNITLQYALGDDWDQFLAAELRVCVRVCGVLLVDVYVRTNTTFDGWAPEYLRDKRIICLGAHTYQSSSTDIALRGEKRVVLEYYNSNYNYDCKFSAFLNKK